MKCEICNRETSDYEIREVIFQYFSGTPKLPIYDYICSECAMKIRMFMDWLHK